MQILKMDFQSQSAPPIVPVMQSDSQSRFIGIALYNGGAPYEAPQGASYTVQYCGPGANNIGWYDTILIGETGHAAVTVDKENPHIVTLELAQQALQVAGDVHVNLCVMGGNGYMLRTFDIIARVHAAAYPDETSVTSYFYITAAQSASWLSYLTGCQQAQQLAQQAQESAQQLASAADDAATSAKKCADSAGLSAGAALTNAKEARQAASQIRSIANGCLGYYETAAALRKAYPTPDPGSWAIVAETQTLFIWNPTTQTWKDASVNVDVSNFYTKAEADQRFGAPYTLPAASAVTLGGIKVGSNLTVGADGTLSAPDPYTLTSSQITSALGYVPANASSLVQQFPYSITYDHSYTGNGSQGTYSSPVRIPLAGDYDAVGVIRTEMSAYPADSEFPKRRVLLELVTQEAADGTFKQNYITLAGLPASFAAANAVNSGLIVTGGQWGRSNVRLRYANQVLDLYYEPSFSGDAPLPQFVWNESGFQYHVFGITWNGGTLHG